jgi:hypothetical protein
MIRYLLIVVFFLGTILNVDAQFPPAAGQPGSTAIHADSSCFVAWAIHCEVERGYINMTDTGITAGGSNYSSYGVPSDALGKADNQVVSLGDKGSAVLTFEYPIVNGPGWDFAVFENSLNDTFLEFAFVEVSSNGTDYFRFPSVSLTQTDDQTGAFGDTEPTKINNLAGKYRVLYGTPFDLDDLDDHPLLDQNLITHVRITDVGGSIQPLHASYDSQGNIINDPFPTPFESCGFDLDAVGVIYNTQTLIQDFAVQKVQVFPNPAKETICFSVIPGSGVKVMIINGYGKIEQMTELNGNCLDISHLNMGAYFMRIIAEDNLFSASFVKL